MFDKVRRALEQEQDVAYAVLFGSGPRCAPASQRRRHRHRVPSCPARHAALGRLTARRESAAEQEVGSRSSTSARS
jgi:hypothetical protein